MLQVFVSFFAFIKYLKVRLFCIKDYKEVLQKKCCSEAAGYSPWSVPALLQSLAGNCKSWHRAPEVWAGVADTSAERGGHAVQSCAPQLTRFNLPAVYSHSSNLNCEMRKKPLVRQWILISAMSRGIVNSLFIPTPQSPGSLWVIMPVLACGAPELYHSKLA